MEERRSPVQTSFERKEKKYLLDQCSYERIRIRLADFMQEDQYGLSTVCSIYYDTKEYDLIHRSLEKPLYKEKFRLRSYGVPREDSVVFAEIKKKYDGIVYKRRVAARLSDMRAFLERGAPLAENEQIQKEIRWFLQRYQPRPVIWLGYERIALTGIRQPELRITFDSNLRYRTDRLDLSQGAEGKLFRPEQFYVMEIKFPASAPLWLAETLSDLEIYPGTFGKYGVCFREQMFSARENSLNSYQETIKQEDYVLC